MDNVLGYLTHEEKLAVMQVGYQLIESAANHALGRRICEDDDPSVDIIIVGHRSLYVYWEQPAG